jgi:signal transduction histidine kinase
MSHGSAEALVNAAKHAPGQPVKVSLDYHADRTALTVRNHLGDGTTAGRDTRFATANGRYGLPWISSSRPALMRSCWTCGCPR